MKHPVTSRVRADEKLVAEARRLGGFKTGKAAATAALTEYVKYHRRLVQAAKRRHAD